MSIVHEPAKQIPVAHEADVVVAGGGVSGITAALSAARLGAHTVLVDRFGQLGGNLGPGVIAGGSLNFSPHVVGGPFGIMKELLDRVKSEAKSDPSIYPDGSGRVSYIALEMMKKAKVQLMLSTYVTDPIMEGRVVRGVYVENKSGRQAVIAKIVIDATGDADIAFRAGAPVILQSDQPSEDVEKIIAQILSRYRGKITDALLDHLEGQLRGQEAFMGLWYAVAGVDCGKFEKFRSEIEPSESDLRWYRQAVTDPGLSPVPGERYPYLRYLREAWERGEFFVVKKVDGLGYVSVTGIERMAPGSNEIASSRISSTGTFDSGNGQHISVAEAEFRAFIYEWIRFLRKYIPGFENSYLLITAPFLGARGGRYIEGEYTMTAADMAEEHRVFEDAIYVYTKTTDDGQLLNMSTDVPYRILLPKVIDGLLATGRSASYGISLRARQSIMVMGQAGGTAAALCVRNNIAPRALQATTLQRELLEAGYYLGDETRLKELGLR